MPGVLFSTLPNLNGVQELRCSDIGWPPTHRRPDGVYIKMPVRKFIKFFNSVRPLSRQKVLTNASLRHRHYDIAINGGGLAGTAMACALAKSPLLADKSVIIFETFSEKPLYKKSKDDQYNIRVFSLNPGTRNFFEGLGVWRYITDVRYATVKKMQVSDACSDALITFNDDLVYDVSYIVEMDVILYALKAALGDENHNITIEYETQIKEMTLPQENKLVRIKTNKGNEYTCDLLIGADGANSQTRKALGKHYLEWDYEQMGIVATLKLSEQTQNIVAWQRFLPSGPIALLPLNDDLSSLVWSTKTEEAKELMKLSEESFVDAVNNAFWKIYSKSQVVQSASDALSRVLAIYTLKSGATRQLPPSVESVLPNSRAAFPLRFGHATEYIGPGVVLIGDAAHTVHPLAGQGVNFGFGDVKCLADILSDGVYSGQRIGSTRLLKRYQSERQKYNFSTMMAIECLQKLYGTTFTPVVALRTLGLQVTHALEPLKNAIMKYASR